LYIILDIEIRQIEHLVAVNLLAIAILVGLPCTYLNARVLRVGEVDHEEEVTHIGIGARVPVLLECDAIDVILDGMANDLELLELQIDVAVAREATLELLDVLLLG
jgi:hypothetical protein